MNNGEYLIGLVHELRKRNRESEWVEWKRSNTNPEQIGKYISALSNSALLYGKDKAYLLWGIDDVTHGIIGTSFSPSRTKIGNEELENWLLQRLKPRINFQFHEFSVHEYNVVLLEISAASKHPTAFINEEFIRVGSYCRKLKDLQEKERELWQLLDQIPFESLPARERLTTEQVLELLDYASYFDLLQIPTPNGRLAILNALLDDELVRQSDDGSYVITNLGAILFAKNLQNFAGLKRKPVRIIQYKGNNKIKTIREQSINKGYAVGFDELIRLIMTFIPSIEKFDRPIRKTITMFPELAVRELVANAVIHQDFFATGTGVMVELFAKRLEISNPGEPLVSVHRFLDSPPKSRNERLASLTRRLGICEERGSGIDKVIFAVEMEQLPAPIFEIPENFTRVILFSHCELKNLTKQDRIHACYLHACLKYIERDYMTSTSLQERFGIAPANAAIASQIISDTVERKLICMYDESAGPKPKKYIPTWARD